MIYLRNNAKYCFSNYPEVVNLHKDFSVISI